MLPTALSGAGRRRTLAVACIVFALLALGTLAGCGGSDDESSTPTTAAETENVTAAEVGQQLKEAGAPITYSVTDTTDVGDPLEPPLMSTAETATDTLDISIEVYDTADHRAEASEQQDENLTENAPELVDSSVKAECGAILVSAVLSDDAATATSQRADFDDVEDALVATFGPC
jgi:hypothetical protein